MIHLISSLILKIFITGLLIITTGFLIKDLFNHKDLIIGPDIKRYVLSFGILAIVIIYCVIDIVMAIITGGYWI